MTDIIERAEACFSSGTSIDHLARELVAALKAARAEAEQLRTAYAKLARRGVNPMTPGINDWGRK